MTYATGPITDDQLQAFLAGAQGVINDHYAKTAPNLKPRVLTLSRGKRWVRVVDKCSADDEHGSAWAFIDPATGLIYKPATWAAPAKHPRGTIHTPSHGAEFVGPYGPAYLRG